jgi:hypothetical protein
MAEIGSRHGGFMRIGRIVIIPAILALGLAGSTLAAAAVPGAHLSDIHAQAQGYASPDVYMHTASPNVYMHTASPNVYMHT